MFRDAKRALYVFLCGLMGSLLFLVIQRSVLLIYIIMAELNPTTFGLGLSVGDVIALDIVAVFLALTGGGWYGVWLGQHWYEVVYEKQTFPGLGMHLAEVFSISNLRISTPPKAGSKKTNPQFANFWQIDDLVSTPLTKTEPEMEERVFHIKPKTKVAEAPVAKKRTVVRRPVVKEMVKQEPVKSSLKKRVVKRQTV